MSQTILIVEDKEAFRSMLKVQLEVEGFKVFDAGDGQSGLVVALAEHPDLILLDIVMPVMDGITMLKKLREDTWGKKAKVIMLTNLPEIGKIAADLKENNAYDYIIKSELSLDSIVARVREKIK